MASFSFNRASFARCFFLSYAGPEFALLNWAWLLKALLTRFLCARAAAAAAAAACC